MSRIVRVTHDQVESARALVRLAEREGIPIDPIYVKIAKARREEPGDQPENAKTPVAS